jgi:multicomponent Na+:H+ antiporter subunit D
MLVLRRIGRVRAGVALVVVLATLLSDVLLFQRVSLSGPVSMTMGDWLPPFGISFTADLASASFATIAEIVALVVIAYAGLERRPDAEPAGFHPLFLLLLAGVSGAFLTGDLFNLYVWFEVILIASFGLLILGGEPLQLDGAIKYGLLNFLATTFFLLALGLLYGLIGTLNMADIALSAPRANPTALAAIGGLLLLAFAIKAAAFPVNAWLPASYHTPPVVIAALFAGLLTKVGVYALLRIEIALLPATREFLEPAIAAVAILTLVLAPLGAIAETNLRRAVGFFVIGGIGAAIAGMAVPTLQGVAGSLAYVAASMLTMTALYLVAGLIERATGATDTRLMGGLYAASSPLSGMFLVLVLGAAGMPPFLSFWPKLLLVGAGLEQAIVGGSEEPGAYARAIAVILALLVNAVLTLIAGTRLWAHIFWRAGPEGSRSERDNPSLRALSRRENWLGLVPAAALTLVILGMGLWPGLLLDSGRAAAAVLLDPSSYIAAVGLGSAP